MNWNKNYASKEYRYGKEAVAFLIETLDGVQPRRALCIGAGEGRNAVWLARQGWEVTALDISEVGLGKAEALAEEQGVKIETIVGDAAEWNPGARQWDLITLFFIHAPPPLRARIHRNAAKVLAPGGLLVLEGFTPRQLAMGTGGPGTSQTGKTAPPDVNGLFIEPEELPEQLPGLEILRLEEEEIKLVGGTHHSGRGVVVHCVGRRRVV